MKVLHYKMPNNKKWFSASIVESKLGTNKTKNILWQLNGRLPRLGVSEKIFYLNFYMVFADYIRGHADHEDS